MHTKRKSHFSTSRTNLWRCKIEGTNRILPGVSLWGVNFVTEIRQFR